MSLARQDREGILPVQSLTDYLTQRRLAGPVTHLLDLLESRLKTSNDCQGIDSVSNDVVFLKIGCPTGRIEAAQTTIARADAPPQGSLTQTPRKIKGAIGTVHQL